MGAPPGSQPLIKGSPVTSQGRESRRAIWLFCQGNIFGARRNLSDPREGKEGESGTWASRRVACGFRRQMLLAWSRVL